MDAAPASELPAALEAHEPPEARGVARDGVRLMVGSRAGARIEHRTFAELPEVLAAGDLLVVNTSATLPAAVGATLPDGSSPSISASSPGTLCSGGGRSEMSSPGNASWCMRVFMSPGSTA